MDVIVTSDLTKYYGRARGIDGLDLHVKKGDIFGFIGPNGAGKSTTIRTLLGLIKPTSGEASVLGMDITRERRKILENTGYMPSETAFDHGMRVRDIISYSARLRHKDCSAYAGELCERLALDKNRKIDDLSLGNRKKVSIVCAMQHQPELYIFDEPTSGLDPLMQKAFFEIILEQKARGATVFLSSHVLSEIQRYCNRAAIVREGRVIACDAVENLAKTKAKRVTVYGEGDMAGFCQLEAMETRDFQSSGTSVSFLYHGDMKKLVYRLSGLPVTDLTIAEPDMDEIFLHYYSGESREEGTHYYSGENGEESIDNYNDESGEGRTKRW